MSTQRDQVQGQRYIRRRIVNALITSDADTQHTPLRTLASASVVSGVLSVALVLGFMAYGYVNKGGNTEWQEEGAVVIEAETGTRYINLAGVLHPVLNLTSALLISGAADAEAIQVSANSIVEAPRGTPLGIIGAPDAVPSAEDLLHTAWTACTAVAPPGSGALGARVTVRPVTTVSGRELQPDEALLVRSANGPELVWNGARWPIQDGDEGHVLTAFAEPAAAPIDVGPAWANTTPAMGRGLALPDIDWGGEGVLVSGQPTRIGQVLRTRVDDRVQHYLVYADGLVPISTPFAALVLASPEHTDLYLDGNAQAQTVATAAVNTVSIIEPEPRIAAVPDALPDVINDTIPAESALCARFLAGDSEPTLYIDAPHSALSADVWTSRSSGGAVDYAIADLVIMPPGSAALVRTPTGGDVSAGPIYLISDQGVKFAIPDDGSLEALGYGEVVPDVLAASVLAAIPTGPPLDADAAREVIDAGSLASREGQPD